MPVRHDKQVRFAYKNTFHSPPVTPAMPPPLTFSTSTAPSSLGVLTPPTATYPVSPILPSPHGAAYDKPLPPGYDGISRPHPYLGMTGITWNLMDGPSTITYHHQEPYKRTWKESATTPPLPFITITIAGFPWRFKVYASNHSYVTFEDVVEKVYRSLRSNVSETEFHTTAAANQRRATRAYEERYRRLRGTKYYEEEKRGGMKRVDFLMGRTHFAGLTNTSRRTDEWHLSVT